MTAPTVGMALIVRDEADKITRCLDSFVDHVDVVAIVDTGSTDDTRDVIRDYFKSRPSPTPKLALGQFEWIDDFGAARRAADQLLLDAGVDWLSWIDADDTIRHPENLRKLATNAGHGVVAFGANYNYASDGHGNCFPAGTEVFGLRPNAATERAYSGDLVRLVFAGGNELAVTPNHPILTPSGWIGAGFLHEGDHVISGRFADLDPAVGVDDRQVPAPIEEVARAIGEAPNALSVAVPTVAQDFHGDGGGSEIHVVRAHRFLLDDVDAAREHHLGQDVLGRGNEEALVLAGEGAGLARSEAVALAPARGLSDRNSSGRDGGVLLGGDELLRLRQATQFDSGGEQTPRDGATADPIAIGEALAGFAGQVTSDEVVRVERYPFAGHVFNLETPGHWYAANGVIVHNCICTLRRERLVKAGHGTWQDPVHEHQRLDGGILQWVAPDLLEWVHDNKNPDASKRASERNRALLHEWVERDPTNGRVLAYLGAETLAAGDCEASLEWYRRYHEAPDTPIEERVQAYRRMAHALFDLGRVDEAMAGAFDAIRLHPDWPDSYLTMAEGHYRRGEYEHAAYWARKVIDHGQPDTLLIVNPLDYTLQPRIILAGALGEMGRTVEALKVAEEGLQIQPDEPRLQQAGHVWQAKTVRDQAAARAVEQAQVLVAHDEQWKALRLLEDTVPYFAQDHPDVVACRSQLRERLLFVTDPAAYAEHYETGGSKAEDFLADDTAMEVAGRLPRARFLAEGLAEQAAA